LANDAPVPGPTPRIKFENKIFFFYFFLPTTTAIGFFVAIFYYLKRYLK
jgi:hypothetical protein